MAQRFWLVCALSLVMALSLVDVRLAAGQSAIAARSTAVVSRAEMEHFLLNARIVKTAGAKKGITNTTRATLSDGTLTHDASIQTIDESRSRFETAMGTELNFRDTWKFNVAAYLLDKLLDLNMVPVSVERQHRGKDGAFTWWVDDVLMDEAERMRKKVKPPDLQGWNEQMYIVRIFDQLIYNTDRNLGNLLISADWRIWMIDHSRAFRWHKDLRDARNLTRADRRVLERLRALDEKDVAREMKRYLGDNEIEALMVRRDLIVKHFETAGATALYDASRRP